MSDDQSTNDPSDQLRRALHQARREERVSEAVWRQKRAEVARLLAAGEEEAARRLLSQDGAVGDTPREPLESIRESAKPRTNEARPAASSSAPAAAPEKKPTLQAAPSKDQAAPIEKKPAAPLTIRARGIPASTRRRRRREAPKGFAGWLGKRPPWALSLTVHGVMLAAFALATFASLNEPPLFLTAALAEDDAWSDMPTETLVELDTDPTLDPIDTPVELTSLVEPALAEFDAVAAVDLTAVAFEGDLLAIDSDALMAEVGGATDGRDAGAAPQGQPAPPGKPGKVRFFGAESVADRVAFVVDNSGSMQRGRMETTLMELDRAVQSLSPSQSFYVVFFSDQAYPMFFPEPVDQMLPATRDNKRRLSAWLGSVEMCLGGRLLDAVELAASLEPQVVYLLSDGDIRSQRVMGRLTEPEAWPFAVHTLGMAARSQQHAENLAAIARANNGGFRLVQAHPAAVRRAMTRPIAYHRETGAVWGSRVQKW